MGDCLLYDESILHELLKLIASLVWGNHNGTLFGLALPTIGRIWFLPALFWTKFFYRILMRILMLYFDEKSRLYILLPLSYVSMFVGMHGVRLPQNFDMLFVCMLFVEIGNILRRIDLKTIKWWIIIGLFGIWTYFSCTQNVWISMNCREYPGYGLCILVAIASNICIFLFSQVIETLNISKLLVFFGKNSLILLVIESITPYFYNAQTILTKAICFITELILVVLYVYGKKIIANIIKK